MHTDKTEELLEQLQDLTQRIPEWTAISRKTIRDRLLRSIASRYSQLPSPEPRENIDNGLDFLKWVLAEGGDYVFYDATLGTLDSDLYMAVKKLDGNDQIILLLGYCDELSLQELSEHPVNDWSKVLLQCYAEWQYPLRDDFIDFIRQH